MSDNKNYYNIFCDFGIKNNFKLKAIQKMHMKIKNEFCNPKIINLPYHKITINNEINYC